MDFTVFSELPAPQLDRQTPFPVDDDAIPLTHEGAKRVGRWLSELCRTPGLHDPILSKRLRLNRSQRQRAALQAKFDDLNRGGEREEIIEKAHGIDADLTLFSDTVSVIDQAERFSHLYEHLFETDSCPVSQAGLPPVEAVPDLPKLPSLLARFGNKIYGFFVGCMAVMLPPFVFRILSTVIKTYCDTTNVEQSSHDGSSITTQIKGPRLAHTYQDIDSAHVLKKRHFTTIESYARCPAKRHKLDWMPPHRPEPIFDTQPRAASAQSDTPLAESKDGVVLKFLFRDLLSGNIESANAKLPYFAAKLRQTLELKAIATGSALNSTGQPVSFMTLPVEIRNMIYHEIVNGKRLTLYKGEQCSLLYQRSYLKPPNTPAFLLVSRQFSAEIRTMLFSRAVFRAYGTGVPHHDAFLKTSIQGRIQFITQLAAMLETMPWTSNELVLQAIKDDRIINILDPRGDSLARAVDAFKRAATLP